MKTQKQRALITSIDDLNKNFEVKMTNCLTTRITENDHAKF